MDEALCVNCTTLYEAALDAIIRHNYARSRLAIAKLQGHEQQIRVWEPVVKHLYKVRSAAIQAYQEHMDSHAQKTAQSGA